MATPLPDIPSWLLVKPTRQPLTDAAGLRSPPHNFEAEKALLGAIFANNNAYDRVSTSCARATSQTRSWSNLRGHSKLIERGQIADPITLNNF